MSFNISHFSSKQSQNDRTLTYSKLFEISALVFNRFIAIKQIVFTIFTGFRMYLSFAGFHLWLWRQNDVIVKNMKIVAVI